MFGIGLGGRQHLGRRAALGRRRALEVVEGVDKVVVVPATSLSFGGSLLGGFQGDWLWPPARVIEMSLRSG